MRWAVGGGRVLDTADHTLVMGVLNVTPDSFSDGGKFLAFDAAVAHGLQMRVDGADIVDVGGESTRPGSDPVPAAEEIDRVVPVIRALVSAGVAVSVDTSKVEVAAAAIDAGAVIVNDVTALGDPEMVSLVSTAGVGVVLMHLPGTPRTMQADPHYDDVVGEVTAYLLARVEAAQAAGVAPDRIVVDPGIGFGKTLAHNLDLLTTGVARLADTGHPVLVGASRKSFLERVLGPLSPEDRDPPTAVAHAVAIVAGASIIRVHNVVMGTRCARVVDAIVRVEDI
ncbi:MAG TPA: dihydropteroate synthase [Acidimicrobiia bacterium]|nr:dihydropteroate synthase [Acidimicrobiia bacterium]